MGFFFGGGGCLPEDVAQRLGWSQFPQGDDGERECHIILQGQVGWVLICVYFNLCQEWVGMHWFMIAMTADAVPHAPPHNRKWTHSFIQASQNSVMWILWTINSGILTECCCVFSKSFQQWLHPVWVAKCSSWGTVSSSVRGRWEGGQCTVEQGLSAFCVWGLKRAFLC